MKLFRSFLKERIGSFFLYIVLFGMLLLIFYLYRLPLQAVIYPFLVYFAFGLIYLTYVFLKYKLKYEELHKLSEISSPSISKLPNPQNIIEREYQTLIYNLQADIQQKELLFQKEFDDMIDYYTLWVHQIKTPISSMSLALQNEDNQLSRNVSLELKKIEQYVDMVMAYLRLDSLSSDYVFREQPLEGLVKRAVKKFSTDFIQKRIQLILEPISTNIVTDEKWLVFVIEQLISNSLKYTHEGYIKIFMKSNNTLCIEDSGIGIAPEDLPRIFEKGYSGYTGRKDLRASGIGLFLCKRICNNLGAKIEATSRVGCKTVICIEFEQYNCIKE